MKRELKKNLKKELIWTNTKQGAFQRSHIYKKNIDNQIKSEIRLFIKQYLDEKLFQKYRNKSISEIDLIKQIERFQKSTNKKYSKYLKGSSIRFGNAQKFINLYLKNMWILGETKEPPHFPVDRIIQKWTKTNLPWTKMDKPKYLKVINSAKKLNIDSNKSLSIWEAEKYYLEINKR